MEPIDTLFLQQGRQLTQQTFQPNAAFPFKNHPQFCELIDVLCRKNNHHLFVCADFSEPLQQAFLQAAFHHFVQAKVPSYWQYANIIYFDVDLQQLTPAKEKAFLEDLQLLKLELERKENYFLIAFANGQVHKKKHRSASLKQQITLLASHPRCRLLFFIREAEQHLFQHQQTDYHFLAIHQPTNADNLLLLKQERSALEVYHHVMIPDELLTLAYSLSQRYLSTTNPLQQALLLLDSSAARAQIANQPLTLELLLMVLSHTTHIPVSHLQPHRFQLNDFIQNMQQCIFGQDNAIHLIGTGLLQAKAHLQLSTGPFCHFLFVGPTSSGKKTTAVALAEQLFKQPSVLYFADLKNAPVTALAQLKVSDHPLTVHEVIAKKPYAIIVFEHIEHAPTMMMNDLQTILTTGFLHLAQGKLDFRQSIIIMTSNIGSDRLSVLTNPLHAADSFQDMDLMQLVMNEPKASSWTPTPHYSPEELIEEIVPIIKTHLPATLIQNCNIVPFLPHSKTSLEKITRLKLNVLSQQLDVGYGIELNFAPEVVRYLTQEILLTQEEDDQTRIDIEKVIKQLYFCVEQAILTQPVDNRVGRKQLFLQLNETGQTLRCDWGLAQVRV